MDVPEIHYTRSGDVAIAYQVAGRGTFDLVFVPTFANLVFPWLNRDWKSFYERLASFARLIMLDKRGTGLSDRPRDLGSLEARMLLRDAPEADKERWCNEAFAAILQEDEQAVPKAAALVQRVRGLTGS